MKTLFVRILIFAIPVSVNAQYFDCESSVWDMLGGISYYLPNCTNDDSVDFFKSSEYFYIMEDKDSLSKKHKYEARGNVLIEFEWNNSNTIDPSDLIRISYKSKKQSFTATLNNCDMITINTSYTKGNKKNHYKGEYNQDSNQYVINQGSFKSIINFNDGYLENYFDDYLIYNYECKEDNRILIEEYYAQSDKIRTSEIYDNLEGQGIFEEFYFNGNTLSLGAYNDNGAYGDWIYLSESGNYMAEATIDTITYNLKPLFDKTYIEIKKRDKNKKFNIFYDSISRDRKIKPSKLIKILNKY